MKRPQFLLVTALLSFGFGFLLFFGPALPARMWGIPHDPLTVSLLRGLGGLIIGFGMINFLLRRQDDVRVYKTVLWTNIITNLFGLAADLLGVFAGALSLTKMAPVELTHAFIIVGSFFFGVFG
jgi:hypothetical protein